MAGVNPTTTLPINKLIYNPTTATSGANSLSSTSGASDSQVTSQLGPSAFLKLLTTQLANQDPTKPMDDTQSVAQLAQFSALQAQDNLQTSFAAFQSNFAVLQSAALIGKNVSVNTTDASGNSSTVTGQVGPITVVNGTPTFTMLDSKGQIVYGADGKPLTFTSAQIVGIGS